MKSKINKHTLKTKKTKKINITHKIFNFLQKGGLFGFFKSKMTGVNPWWGGVKVMMTGALAATAAFGIAKLIQG